MRLIKIFLVFLFLFTFTYLLLSENYIITVLKFEDVTLQKTFRTQIEELNQHNLVQIEVSPTITFQNKSWFTKPFGNTQRLTLSVVIDDQNLIYNIENPTLLSLGEIKKWSMYTNNKFLGFKENVDIKTNSYDINKKNIKLIIMQTSDTLFVGDSVLIRTPLLSF